MLASIKYNLKHLTDFGGRDARPTFWYYMLFLVILQFVIGFVAVIPATVSMIMDSVAVVGDGSDPDAIQAAMSETLPDMLRQQVWISLGLSLLTCALFVASFVRRLHDAGYTGWIALIPVATVLFAAWYSIETLDAVIAIAQETMADPMQADAINAQEIAPYSMISYVGFLVVIGFGVLKSQDGPNQYGDEPVRR